LWTFIPATGSIPSPSSGYIAVKLGNIVVKYGGGIQGSGPNNTTYFSETHLFDLNTYVWTSISNSSPTGRMFADAVSINDHQLLMYGGCQYTQIPLHFNAFDEYWIFDILTETWTQVFFTGTLPTPRIEHAMVFDDINQEFYIWGGFQFNLVTLGDMFKCSLVTSSCNLVNQTGDVPIPRVTFIIRNLDDDNFIAAGGYSPVLDEQTSGLFIFNIRYSTWERENFDIENPTEFGRYPTPREGPVFDIVDDVLVVFAGDTDGPNYYNLVNDTVTRNLRTKSGCGPISKKYIWQEQANLESPPPMKRIHTAIFNNELYEFGGLLSGNFIGVETDTSDIWKYTPCIG